MNCGHTFTTSVTSLFFLGESSLALGLIIAPKASGLKCFSMKIILCYAETPRSINLHSWMWRCVHPSYHRRGSTWTTGRIVRGNAGGGRQKTLAGHGISELSSVLWMVSYNLEVILNKYLVHEVSTFAGVAVGYSSTAITSVDLFWLIFILVYHVILQHCGCPFLRRSESTKYHTRKQKGDGKVMNTVVWGRTKQWYFPAMIKPWSRDHQLMKPLRKFKQFTSFRNIIIIPIVTDRDIWSYLSTEVVITHFNKDKNICTSLHQT